jgi:hypothetical protein
MVQAEAVIPGHGGNFFPYSLPFDNKKGYQEVIRAQGSFPDQVPEGRAGPEASVSLKWVHLFWILRINPSQIYD